MAIEIVDFPIKNGGSFHCYVSSPEGNQFIRIPIELHLISMRWALGHVPMVPRAFMGSFRGPHGRSWKFAGPAIGFWHDFKRNPLTGS